MKDLKKINVSGSNELVRGNNKKFLVFDNFFKNKYPNSNLQLIVTFYDINNTANLVGITDINDVSEWNTFFNYDEYGGIVDKDWNPIEFESCVVDGNNLTLVPPNKDYSVIYAIEMYEYNSLGKHLIEDITVNGLPLFNINLYDDVLARNINADVSNRIGKYDPYNDDNFYFTLDSYGFTGDTFNTNNLTNLTYLEINDAQNLTTINFKNLPHATSLGINQVPLLENLSFENLPHVTSLGISVAQSLRTVNFNNLSHLTSLAIKEVPLLENLSFENLPSLESLSLSYLDFSEVNLNNLSSLNSLSLSYLDFSGITLNNLPSLNSLSLTHLTNLQSLDLSELNSISQVYLTEIPTLETLIIDNSNLDNINLYNVGILEFNNNILSGLTRIFWQNSSLEKFNDNELISLDVLYLDNNNLSEFTGNTLPNITYLGLSHNLLTSIDISGLNNISTLNLYNNNLDENSVNAVLAKLVSNPINSGALDLSGGSNATPTAQGLIDKATLESRGWTVTTN